MYCKNCGFDNPENANYCLKDGYPLKKDLQGFIFEKAESNYCKSCGKENESSASYCSSCGRSLLQPKSNKNVMSQVSSKVSTKDLGGVKELGLGSFSPFVKPALIGVAISFAILILISLIIQSSVTGFITSYVEDNIGLGGFFDNNIKLFGITDVMMLSHMIGSVFSMSAMDNANEASIHIGLYLLLFIPFIGLLIGGFVTANLHRDLTVIEKIKTSILIGLIYAGILAFISFFAGFSYKGEIIFVGKVNAGNSYTFFGSLFNGLFFGFIFSLFGLLLQHGKLKITSQLRNSIPYGESIHQGISTVFRGFGISILFILLLVALSSGDVKDYYGWEELKLFPVLLIGVQAGAFFWNILNFVSLHLGNDLTMSIFSILKGNDFDHFMINQLLQEYSFLFYLALLIPIFLFYLAGKKIKKNTNGNVYREILIYGLTYSIVLSLFISVGDITFADELSIGFNFFATFFISLIVSLIVSFVGYVFTTPVEEVYSNKISNKIEA